MNSYKMIDEPIILLNLRIFAAILFCSTPKIKNGCLSKVLLYPTNNL
jgi:hypothetical protein